MYVAKLMYHKWEEEPISGIEHGYNGTFAIFFYGCNMHCIYCQNYKISRNVGAKLREPTVGASYTSPLVLSSQDLAKKMIEAETNGAASISFITGVFYTDLIVETIKLAKAMGLEIPIVYNTSSYENVNQLKKLNGLIDIYLPDFKYYDNNLALKYSGRPHYVETAKECITEMYSQIVAANTVSPNVGASYTSPKLIVRHLILPSHTEDSKKIIKYLYETYGDNIYISILSQYTPILENKEIAQYDELKRRITRREYEKVVDFAISLGVKNAYIQDLDSAKNIFIPDF